MAKKINSKATILKLKQQLSSKPAVKTVTAARPSNSISSNTGFKLPTQPDNPITSRSIQTDTAYLRRDLTKIAIFTVIGIGAQFGLFFALRNGLTIRGF